MKSGQIKKSFKNGLMLVTSIVIMVGLVSCSSNNEKSTKTKTKTKKLKPAEQVEGERIKENNKNNYQADFGEKIDLGSGLTITISDPKIGGDDLGPWLDVSARAENSGEEDVWRAWIHGQRQHGGRSQRERRHDGEGLPTTRQHLARTSQRRSVRHGRAPDGWVAQSSRPRRPTHSMGRHGRRLRAEFASQIAGSVGRAIGEAVLHADWVFEGAPPLRATYLRGA